MRGWSAAGQEKKNHLQLGGLSFCKLVEVGTKGLVWFGLVFFFLFFWFLFLGGALLECGRSPIPTVFPKIGFSHQTTPSPTRVAKFATNALSMPLSLPAFLFLCAAAAAAAARPLPYQQQ